MKQGIIILTPIIFFLWLFVGLEIGFWFAVKVIMLALIVTFLIAWWVNFCIKRF